MERLPYEATFKSIFTVQGAEYIIFFWSFFIYYLIFFVLNLWFVGIILYTTSKILDFFWSLFWTSDSWELREKSRYFAKPQFYIEGNRMHGSSLHAFPQFMRHFRFRLHLGYSTIRPWENVINVLIAKMPMQLRVTYKRYPDEEALLVALSRMHTFTGWSNC